MAYFEDNVVWMMDRLMADFGVEKLDAAAVFGNAGQESGGFKSLQELKPLVPGSRGGFGIMQWTGSRRRDFEAYCKKTGKNPILMQTNYDFLFVELKGPEGKVLPKLRAAKTLDQKTEVFMETFLRPGIPHLDSRKRWALKALRAYESTKFIPKPEVPKTEVPKVGEVKTKKSILQLIIGIILKIVRSK